MRIKLLKDSNVTFHMKFKNGSTMDYVYIAEKIYKFNDLYIAEAIFKTIVRYYDREVPRSDRYYYLQLLLEHICE
jgi:hypothetical protein